MAAMKPFFDIKAQYMAHREEIDQVIKEVLLEGRFIMGPQVRELEAQLEAYSAAKHCVSCANGTDALQIALMAIGLEPGDEVITTPFTFISTAESIKLLGGNPVFVDIEQESFLINADLIEANITSKTKAILPVSLYGQVADMDRINEIAKIYSEKLGHKIYVIEDAAQSFGATYKERKSCNVSDIATTSFFPTKPLGCYGDGGAIFALDNDLAQAMREIRVHGQSRRYYHTRVGINSRLDTLQAAILLVKLKYFDDEVKVRQQVASDYNQFYENIDAITPNVLPNRTHVYGQYTLRVKERDQFREELKAKGVPTSVHYPVPLHRQPAFMGEQGEHPVADRLSDEVVSLPVNLYNCSNEDKK